MTRFEKFKLCISLEASHLKRWYSEKLADFIGAFLLLIAIPVMVVVKLPVAIFNIVTLPFTATDEQFDRAKRIHDAK